MPHSSTHLSHQCHISVPIKAAFQCQSVLPVRAAYQ
ncbi:unnamed protein product, partial [Staurois parvus]